jgi:hypothetical protein
METGMQLREEGSKIDNIMDSLMQDPEVRQILLTKLKTMAMAMDR